MRALGFDVKKADVLKILRDYDREGTGKISFDDFNETSEFFFFFFLKIFLVENDLQTLSAAVGNISETYGC